MRTFKPTQTILLTLAALLLFCKGSYAQTITTGDLNGTLTDASGAVIPAATVTLKSLDTGESRVQTSNNEGVYRFNLLPPGHYELAASSAGLKSDATRVVVAVGQVMSANLLLKVEESKQTVVVTEASSVVQSDNANLATTFSSQQVALLPAPGGDLTTVAFTVPGVTVNTGGGYGNFSSHGLPGTANLFQINGNDYNDPYLNLNNSGASNLLLGQNEVAEVSVVQNGYSVQYGRNAGAQVSFITKNGTNSFHGALVYNWNGSIMNATDFFTNLNGLQKPHAVSNSYAASLGGPIKKNKLFFFTDTEGIRYTLPTGGVVTFPSPQFQNYILSTVAPSAVSLYKSAFNEYSGVLARASPVTTGNSPTQDSTGALGCGGFAGTPALSGGGAFGVNIPCAYSYATNAANTNEEWLMTYRVDWNINDANRIYFRFKTDHGVQPTETNLVNPLYNVTSVQPQYEGQINLTSTISPTMVNSFIGSVLWYSAIFASPNINQVISTLPVNLFLEEGGSNSGWYGFGFGPTGQGFGFDVFPQGRNSGQLGLVDDLSKVWGKHTVKVGVNFRKNNVTDYTVQEAANGTYVFNSVADFAAGVTNPNTGSLYFQNFAPASADHIFLYNLGLYVQDEWAVKENFKITYGIRLERTADPTCKEDCFQRLNAPFGTAGATINTPYNQSITGGLAQAYPSVPALIPAPRVGVVWKPFKGTNSTVIRTGFGLFTDLPPGNLVASVFNQAPYTFEGAVFNGAPVGLASTPGTAAAGALAQYNAFKTGYAAGDNLTQLNNAVPGGFSPINFFAVPKNLSSPEYAEWSFEIEQPIGHKNVLSATYTGNHGYNLFLTNPFANTNVNTDNFPKGFGGLPVNAPDARFNAVTVLANSGVSNYDGLSVQFRRAFAAGFQGQLGYTWSHALDDLSSLPGEPFSFANSVVTLNSPYPRLNYSNSDFDVRHNLVADFLWDTPFKPSNRALSWLVKSWTVSGKFYARTGVPFSVTDSLLAGEISPAVGAGGTVTATPIGKVPTSCGSGAVSTPCFTASNFIAQGAETNWGIPRNSFYGPGYFDIDTAVYKNFEIHEGVRLAVGFQGANILNHPNFANPTGNIASPGLGQIFSTVGAPTSAYGSFQGSAVTGRVMTLSGRFTF